MQSTITTILLLYCCSAMTPTSVSGQTFPYDLDERESVDTATATLRLHRFSDHLITFGLDTVTVEVYFEQRKTTKMPENSIMAYRSECVQTLLLHTSIAAGSYFYPTTRKDGRYILYFFRNGCFVESSFDTLPDGTTSTFFGVWGKCGPPEKTTRI
jgi:hypothetical protein